MTWINYNSISDSDSDSNSDSGGGGGCFPSTAKVNLKNGRPVSMSELKIGDQVQAGKRLQAFYHTINGNIIVYYVISIMLI